MVFAVVKKDGAGKRRPKQNATENTRKKEKAQNSKYADERRIMGRFAKRFSGGFAFRPRFHLSIQANASNLAAVFTAFD